jgi:hypothetical protein
MAFGRAVKIIVCGLLIVGLGAAVRPGRAESLPAYERSLIGLVRLPGGAAIQAVGSPARSLGKLDTQERVIVIGRSGKLLRALSRFGEGVVAADALDLQGDSAKLPVIPENQPAAPLPDSAPPDNAKDYPVLPVVTPYAAQIFQRGLSLGNRPEVFARAGDCMSSDGFLFLGKFGSDNYDLGSYSALQAVIDYYRKVSPRPGTVNSFLAPSYAAQNGFNASAVEDPLWLDTAVCPEGSSPLACEYQLTKPAVSIIMFGTNDILSLTAAQYDFYLRLVVFDTIDRGIIPLLSTFPGNLNVSKRANQFNQIVYRVARDYDVPVMNLWLALQPLPGKGLDAGTGYLSQVATTRVSYFTKANLQYGYTVRNLITLQALDIVWRQVIQPAA